MVGDGDFFDDQRLAIFRIHRFAGLVLDTAKRSIIPGVDTPLPRRRETQFNPAGRGFDHEAQSEF
jgi:hypothetical protein